MTTLNLKKILQSLDNIDDNLKKFSKNIAYFQSIMLENINKNEIANPRYIECNNAYNNVGDHVRGMIYSQIKLNGYQSYDDFADKAPEFVAWKDHKLGVMGVWSAKRMPIIFSHFENMRLKKDMSEASRQLFNIYKPAMDILDKMSQCLIYMSDKRVKLTKKQIHSVDEDNTEYQNISALAVQKITEMTLNMIRPMLSEFENNLYEKRMSIINFIELESDGKTKLNKLYSMDASLTRLYKIFPNCELLPDWQNILKIKTKQDTESIANSYVSKSVLKLGEIFDAVDNGFDIKVTNAWIENNTIGGTFHFECQSPSISFDTQTKMKINYSVYGKEFLQFPFLFKAITINDTHHIDMSEEDIKTAIKEATTLSPSIK